MGAAIAAQQARNDDHNAMTEKLFVSDCAVRTHLRNMTLDAQSRTQAVAIARKLGVIR